VWDLHSLMHSGPGVSSDGGQDCLVHAPRQAAHCVDKGCMRVVHWSWLGGHCIGVIFVDVATVHMAVVPIPVVLVWYWWAYVCLTAVGQLLWKVRGLLKASSAPTCPKQRA
jgi:hypothetical protein